MLMNFYPPISFKSVITIKCQEFEDILIVLIYNNIVLYVEFIFMILDF